MRGFATKFLGRMTKAETDIREALAAGDHRKAVHFAVAAYYSEAAKLRSRRPHDGALTDAQIAASLLAVTEGLSTYKPDRSGEPRGEPSPGRLLDAFVRALEMARTDGAR